MPSRSMYAAMVESTNETPRTGGRGPDTGGCKYVKTRIENPGGTGLYPQKAETGE